jgi:hypothetical protein
MLAATQKALDRHADDSLWFVEALRVSLIRLAGRDGFTSLLDRALVLAGRENPSLRRVKVNAEGRLQGLDQAVSNDGGDAARVEAAVAITAQVFGLLATFIGEPLALKVVREAWPDTSMDE